MKTIRTYKVKIGQIYCTKVSGNSRGYYNFDFWLYENGKLKEWGNYDGDFTNPKYIKPRGVEAFRKVLKRGEAHRLVLQRYI